MTNKQEDEISLVQAGVDVIQSYLRHLYDKPGVYQMINARGEALYIGKAKSLKKRVSSYTRPANLPLRLKRMIAQTVSMEFINTNTEAEALLLEANLIKKRKPRFNILLRDDKSFPYIFLAQEHDFPLIRKHRGAKKEKGTYYGPFASAGDVNRTINILQRAFMLRNCTDSYFSQRKRPCLQYHIKRCSAPCVGLVSKQNYAEQISQAKDFLEGKSRKVQEAFAKQMQQASQDEEYELAASYRDRIRALTSIQARQDINIQGIQNADVLAICQKGGHTCVQVFFFRSGQNYGQSSFYPRHGEDERAEDILAAFLGQFYQNKMIPKEVITSLALTDSSLLEEALSVSAGYKVSLISPIRGRKKQVVLFAERNAQLALDRRLAERASQDMIIEELQSVLELDGPPSRIEVYDNSHISGTDMVGAMVVAGPDGFQKNAYRKFNIKQADRSDDYGMMREVIFRRFSRALKEDPQMEGEQWPDLILIDGGKGQLSAVFEVLEDLGLAEAFQVVAIAKGEDRNAGRETFFMRGRKSFQLPVNHAALHYLQRLRDEAHRFAIGSHRSKRHAKITESPLDGISGVGAKRKKALLTFFGSAKAVAGASVDELARVEGVSAAMAQTIYDHFHE